MSKNLTRKGLAFGAIVALGTSLFAGAPAQAAPAITAAPTVGTGYTVLASDTFTLKVYGNTDFSFATTSPLVWKVTKPASTASVVFENQGSGTPTATAASTSTISYLTPSAVVATTAGNTLKLTPTIGATGTSSDYIVQPFLDLDGSGALDSADLAGNAVTIKFVKGAELTSVVTLDPVSAGLAATGTVKYTSTDFNYAQSTLANTNVLINKNGGTFSAAQSVTLSDAKDSFEYSIADGTAAVTAGAIIGVKSQVKGYDSDSTFTNSAAVYATASAASDALGADLTVTPGDNLAVSSGSSLTTNYSVRSGTKAFSYRVDFYKEAGLVNAIAAGKPVRITINELSTTIATNDVIRVNGKKLTGADGDQADAVLNTVTDANGGITVSVESDLGLAGDSVEITVLATGSTGTIQAQNDFTWTAAELKTITALDTQIGGDGSTVAPDYLTVVKGSSVSLKYALRDQFGKLWAPAGYDYRVNVAKGGTGTLTLATTAAFSGGLATVTYTDNTTAANATTTVVATLESKASSATSFGTATSTDANVTGTPITTALNIVSAAQAAAKITKNAAVDDAAATVSDADGAAHASNKVTKADATLAAQDIRSNANGASLGNTKGAKLSGTVYNADGSAAAGVAVTVSAAGLFFSPDVAGSKVVTSGSITVNTNSTGTYYVWALSSKGGTAAISIASGSVTTTQTVKWAAAAATAGKNITITAPDTSLAGRSVDVVVLLTDKYGAPVETTTSGVERLSVSITGPGSNTAVAATTDADGKIAFKLIFGSNDNGTAVVKVTYDADGDTATYSPVVVSKSILVGTAAAPAAATAAIAGSTKRMFVSVTGNSTAKNVVVKVAGKTVATLKGSAAKKTYTIRATKGSKKVTVFVGGKLIATKTVTVK
jgi:hypothetical protein